MWAIGEMTNEMVKAPIAMPMRINMSVHLKITSKMAKVCIALPTEINMKARSSLIVLMVKGLTVIPMAALMWGHSKMVPRLEKPPKPGGQIRHWQVINMLVTSKMAKKTVKALTFKPTEPLTPAPLKVI